MTTRNSFKITALALALAAPSALATNGYFTHGVGAHNKAQAGAGLASPSQAIDAANNPASAVLVDDQTNASLSIFSPRRSYTASASMAQYALMLPTICSGLFSLRAWRKRDPADCLVMFKSIVGFSSLCNSMYLFGFQECDVAHNYPCAGQRVGLQASKYGLDRCCLRQCL